MNVSKVGAILPGRTIGWTTQRSVTHTHTHTHTWFTAVHVFVYIYIHTSEREAEPNPQCICHLIKSNVSTDWLTN
jgi:hypothetical protein